ncbi:choice-of-anchor J domain-containing protein [Ekhidna sp.]
MKKIIYIALFVLLAVACKDDDARDISGIAVGFTQDVVGEITEEDGVNFVFTMNASGLIGDSEAFAIVDVDLSDEGVIFTSPSLNNGTIRVPIVQDSVLTDEGVLVPVVVGQIEVQALNDLIEGGYSATFTITGVEGAVNTISSANTFTLLVRDADSSPIFQEDFESGLNDWTIINAGGSNTWGTTFFDDNTSAIASTFNSTNAVEEDNWLISPEIDFSSFTGGKLSFLSKTRFNDEGNRLEVSFLEGFDGVDPSTATQTIFNPTLDPHEGGGFGTFTSSGDIDLSAINVSGHIAFRFKAVNANDASGWEVDDVVVSAFDPDASGGGTDNLVSLPFSEDFENCTTDFAIPSAFEVQYASGSKDDRGWACRQFGVDGSRAVRVNTFGGDVGTSDTWLITQNQFDLTGTSFADLSFDVQSQGSGDGELKVYYSSDYFGNLSFATWVELDVSSQLPDKGTSTYETVTTMIPGGENVYLAFQFEGSSESSSASYDIDNISLTEATGGGGTFSLPFTDDFESCTVVGDFNIPSNWIEENVPGTKTDRGWGCRAFGRDGTSAPRASAFGGEDGEDDAWLISNGTIDLTSVTSATLVFWAESRFSGPGDLQVLWSTDYSGIGDPNSATWTQLTDVAAQLPAEGSEVFTEITSDMSDAAGSEVYLAFRYFGGTSGASVALTIDDLSLTGS